MLGPNEVLIGDHNANLFAIDQVAGGEHKARGLVPRNHLTHPRGFYAGIKAVDIPLIPDSEWAERCRDLTAQKALLSDIRLRGDNGQPIPSRDQNGRGYCWQHSGVSAMLIDRALRNQPYVSLSAYGPACQVKNFQDEGGWGAQGVDKLIADGCPDEKHWP